MIDSFLITSRETLEASLVVCIVLAYLNKTDNRQYRKSVYHGIAFGIVGSTIAALLFSILTGGFEGRTEEIFEGVTMLVGAFLLTTMILWMLKQQSIPQKIHHEVDAQLQRNQPLMTHFGIALLIFIAILREGVETVIFLNATKYASRTSLIGGLLGLVAAIAIGCAFFMGARRVNLKQVFSISSILLILFSAGLVAHGIHELEEAGIVPSLIEHIYDVNPVVNENSVFGSLLTELFGYNGNPSLVETAVYLIYLSGAIIAYGLVGTKKIINAQSQKET